MVSVYDLKPRFQSLLRPVCHFLVRLRITANMVTVGAMLLSCGIGAVITFQPRDDRILLLLPAALFVRMALNALDGMMAREHQMQSNLGAVLNEVGDVVSDCALYLPLALVHPFDNRLVVLIVVLASLTELVGVMVASLGASRRYDGPMGKSDRAFVFGVLGLLLGLQVPAGWWLSTVLWGVLGLLILTIFNRTRKGLRELDAAAGAQA